MIHQIRVIYGDTDQMGVVYHANYLRYFEASRAAFLRGLGRSYSDLERMGIALPVVEATCLYRRPAHYEDLLDIHVAVSELRRASMRFVYRAVRDGDVLAEGQTRHAVVDPDSGKPRAMPTELRELVERSADEPDDRLVL
ncbi:MAG: thioesterase family protein [Myxococcota bacterium]